MGGITSTELAKIIHQKPSKVKRHIRELLGHDEIAGQQKGYARTLTIEDSFKVFLYGIVINQTNLSSPEAKQAVEEVVWWLEKKGFYPLSRKKFDAFERESMIKSWYLEIQRADGGGFWYTAEGEISLKENIEIIDGNKQAVFTKKYVEEHFYTSSLGDIESIKIPYDKNENRILLSSLIGLFISWMEDQGRL